MIKPVDQAGSAHRRQQQNQGFGMNMAQMAATMAHDHALAAKAAK
jgi:hypothetical protein